MKIVKIYGGLGNQMFQYAFALSLAKLGSGPVSIDYSCYGIDPAHNGFELGRLFGLSLPAAGDEEVRRLSIRPDGIVNRVRRKYFTKPTHFIDRKFRFQPELFRVSGDAYFEGYWQSERYFKAFEREIRAEFSFKLPLSSRNTEMLESLPRPIASVHVRRGDYLLHPNLDICTPAYYSRATRILAESGTASLLVFSDDMDYCRSNLDLAPLPTAFVDWNRNGDSWQDMAMMAGCEQHVIANSSFSWWGAWLNPRSKKRVLAPELWNRREIEDHDKYYEYGFADVVPMEWERVAV